MQKSRGPFVWGAVGCVAIVVAVVVAVVVVTMLARRSIGEELKKTRTALDSTAFECPDGGTVQIQRWSEIGWSRFCEQNGVRHGPWQAWERQMVVIESGYNNGKKHGELRYFNSDGSLYRLIEYRDGVEISDTMVDSS